jgi:hypothetical protein
MGPNANDWGLGNHLLIISPRIPIPPKLDHVFPCLLFLHSLAKWRQLNRYSGRGIFGQTELKKKQPGETEQTKNEQSIERGPEPLNVSN